MFYGSDAMLGLHWNKALDIVVEGQVRVEFCRELQESILESPGRGWSLRESLIGLSLIQFCETFDSLLESNWTLGLTSKF